MRKSVTIFCIFMVSAALIGIAYSWLEVYVFENVDPKFRTDPAFAFKLSLIAPLIFAFLGAIIFTVVLQDILRNNNLGVRMLILTALAGVLFFVGLIIQSEVSTRYFDSLDRKWTWIYILFTPILLGWIVYKFGNGGKNNALEVKNHKIFDQSFEKDD